MIDELRADNPHNAEVPRLVGKHDATRLAIAMTRTQFFECFFEDRFVIFPSLLVQRVQCVGDLFRAHAISGCEKLRSHLRVPHATTGVDARREAERDGFAVTLRWINARRREQRVESDDARFSDCGQPARNDHTIFAKERHNIRDRTDGCERQERDKPFTQHLRKRLRPAPRLTELPSEFPRDTSTAKFAKLLLAWKPRMHDRMRHRNGARRLQFMVIGDDKFEPDVARESRLFHRTHTAVNRDHQIDALVLQRSQRFGVQAVALFDPVRDVGADGQFGRERLQHVPENGGRHNPVDVIVAINGDPSAGANGVANDRSRSRHAVHFGRQLKMVDARVEKRVPGVFLDDATCSKQAIHQPRPGGSVPSPVTVGHIATRLGSNPPLRGKLHWGECNDRAGRWRSTARQPRAGGHRH